jgi:hypothetical protein
MINIMAKWFTWQGNIHIHVGLFCHIERHLGKKVSIFYPPY